MKPRNDLTIANTSKPFESSKIPDREKISKILNRAIKEFDSPMTMALNSTWGGGKTTFLDMWQHEIGPYEAVFRINAWETDFVDSPLLVFLDELTAFVNATFPSTQSIQKRLAKVLSYAAVLPHLIPSEQAATVAAAKITIEHFLTKLKEKKKLISKRPTGS